MGNDTVLNVSMDNKFKFSFVPFPIGIISIPSPKKPSIPNTPIHTHQN